MDPVTVVTSPQAWNFAREVPLDKILAMAQLIILFLIIRWSLMKGHDREIALAAIINTQLNQNTISLDRSTTTIAENTKTLEKMLIFIDALNREVNKRWSEIKESNKYQRDEHARIIALIEKK